MSIISAVFSSLSGSNCRIIVILNIFIWTISGNITTKIFPPCSVIHGARAMRQGVQKRDDPLGEWLKALITRCSAMKAVVALANKLTIS
ncbi:hypothetical protein [Xenorhabdus griffiniae]